MFNYDDLVEKIYLNGKNDSEGFIEFELFKYSELQEALRIAEFGETDEEKNAVERLICSKVVSSGGFQVRGQEPDFTKFDDFPLQLRKKITTAYFEHFNLNGEQKSPAKKK